jgi:hypothetical protein
MRSKPPSLRSSRNNDSGNYPTTCATSFPPTAGGLQSAQNNKQNTEDGVRQLKGQIVETGWKTQ